MSELRLWAAKRPIFQVEMSELQTCFDLYFLSARRHTILPECLNPKEISQRVCLRAANCNAQIERSTWSLIECRSKEKRKRTRSSSPWSVRRVYDDTMCFKSAILYRELCAERGNWLLTLDSFYRSRRNEREERSDKVRSRVVERTYALRLCN